MFKEMKKNIIDLMRFLLWTVIRNFLLFFGPDLISTIESFFAKVAYKVQRGKRHVVREELIKSYGSALDKEQIEQIVKNSFRLYVGFHVRDMYLSKITPKTVESYLPVEGIQYLDESLKKGKGAVIVNPHFGPYLLIMPALGHRGYKVNQIALHADTPEGRTWLDQKVYDIKFANIQGRMPAKFINLAKRANVREAMRVLQKNEIVLLPSTGREGLGWVDVKFMNRTATLNTGAIKMAQSTGASLLPVFLVEEKPFARVIIEKPIVTEDRPIEEILQEYADLMSSYIERRPEHFCMYLHEMFIHRHWDDHPFFPEPRVKNAIDIVIAGGGIAGLTIGGVLSEKGDRCTIIEKSSETGGLSRSLKWGGITFDLGPHFLFMENYPDAVGHVRKTLDNKVKELDFKIGIYFRGYYYPWPPKMLKMLFRFPLSVTLHHLLAPFRRKQLMDESYRCGLSSRHGQYLYDDFFEPYIFKKVSVPGSELHIEWWLKPPRDFSRPDWRSDTMIMNSKTGRFAEIGMLVRKAFMPGQSRVLYPTEGIHAIPDSMRKKYKGVIKTNTKITSLEIIGGHVTAAITDTGEKLPCARLVWTAPITDLASLLNYPQSDLKYIPLMLAFVNIKEKANRGDYLYVYYGDQDVLFNRAYFPASISEDFVPADKDGICLEMNPCIDPVFKDTEKLKRRLLKDIEKVGICSAGDVDEIKLVRMENAYPLYSLDYIEQLNALLDHVRKIKNIYICGRTGAFYNALTDSTVKSAIDTASAILESQN
ncbi:MAG: FAD-dependent oxidoreductase [Deltaproteobacteria bacterium]|nr:FAD-dependent oxidoreductase [Deltaproteobacteria bacterium]